MGVKQDIANLQKQIDNLKGKTDSPFTTAITTNPFSRLGELKEQQGSTGSARFRRIPLYSDLTAEVPETNFHGSFIGMSHTMFINANSDKIYYQGVILPTDYVPGGKITFNYMYSCDVATDTIDWVISVKSIAEGANINVVLLSDTTSVAPPGTIDILDIRSVSCTIFPKTNTVLFATLERTVGDNNGGSVALWATWIEYLAHS